MPLIQRKRTVFAGIRDVLIAPFVLVLASLVHHRWYLLLALGLMLFCYLLNPQPIPLPVIEPREVIIWLLVFAFIIVAAIPLAIRDYFSNGGMETVWEPDAACLEEGRRLAKLLLDRDDESFYESMTAESRSALSLSELSKSLDALEARVGRLRSVVDVAEVPIPHGLYSHPDFNARFEASIRIRFESDKPTENPVAVFYLKCREGFSVVSSQFPEAHEED